MHDFNSKNVTDDPVQIPDQLDEITPLTPVQIFVKDEVIIPDQLEEVVPLTPVQIFIKEEVPCKSEEPVLVSLVPLLPKEEPVDHTLPDEFEDDGGALIINLENSSSEEWSNHSDPLAVERGEAEVAYAEYVGNGDAILLDLGATSAAGSVHTLRVTREAGCAVENGELYDLLASDGIARGSESGSLSPDGDTDPDRADVRRALPILYGCAYCSRSFPTEAEMQTHTLSHVSPGAARREVPRAPVPPQAARPKPVKTLRAQHTCGACSLSFDRLELLMRHRLGHLRTALRKPFSAPERKAVPQPQVPAASSSRRTAAGGPSRASPKRNVQRTVTTSQSKRWARRKKTRRRRVS